MRLARVEENTAADRIELTAEQVERLNTSRRPPASATTKGTWPSSTADHATGRAAVPTPPLTPGSWRSARMQTSPRRRTALSEAPPRPCNRNERSAQPQELEGTIHGQEEANNWIEHSRWLITNSSALRSAPRREIPPRTCSSVLTRRGGGRSNAPVAWLLTAVRPQLVGGVGSRWATEPAGRLLVPRLPRALGCDRLDVPEPTTADRRGPPRGSHRERSLERRSGRVDCHVLQVIEVDAAGAPGATVVYLD